MAAPSSSGPFPSHPRFVPPPAGPANRNTQVSYPPLQTTPRAPHSPEGKPPKLLDQVREAIRVRHYSWRTEETYVQWIKRFILFHGKRDPGAMGAQEIAQFLSALAVERHVSAATQNQALNALVFFNITGCRYAEFFRQLGEPELGAVLLCEGDMHVAELGGSDVEFSRTQTIMKGAQYCNFRYKLKKGAGTVTNFLRK